MRRTRGKSKKTRSSDRRSIDMGLKSTLNMLGNGNRREVDPQQTVCPHLYRGVRLQRNYIRQKREELTVSKKNSTVPTVLWKCIGKIFLHAKYAHLSVLSNNCLLIFPSVILLWCSEQSQIYASFPLDTHTIFLLAVYLRYRFLAKHFIYVQIRIQCITGKWMQSPFDIHDFLLEKPIE